MMYGKTNKSTRPKGFDYSTPMAESFHRFKHLNLRSLLAVAGDLLRPRRPHLHDHQDLANLGHPSIDAEPRRITVTDKDPNDSTVYPHRRPHLVNLSPRLRCQSTKCTAEEPC
ncbi:hypothetical protein GUJ93_ZPchr0013g35624 [Zizania palustris]|uniref:Uncharacterized protein n=1 Tax=Zizania palustris TaxID=103762 RepID=A0A8J6BWR2_ZIZPA|nr:hypothetical protein GUJ93_ZPchr0013g35624 [Zizania palustris]